MQNYWSNPCTTKSSLVVCRQESTSISFSSNFQLLASNTLCSCLGHVVNLAEVDMMTHITEVTAVETATTIWEYDPSLPDNRVLNGSLDVTAAIQTLTIKVGHVSFSLSQFSNLPQIQSSGHCTKGFEKLQAECSLKDSLKIPLHSNVWWGTAHHMLSVSYKIRQVHWCLILAILFI